VGDTFVTRVVRADTLEQGAEFTNIPDSDLGGHGILNEFIYDEKEKKWKHNPAKKSSN